MFLATLTHDEGQWLLLGLGVFTLLLGCVAAFTGILKNLKDLRRRETPAPATPQPLVIAMQEQFVGRTEFDEVKTSMTNQITEMRAYIHDGIHKLREDLQLMAGNSEEREKRQSDRLDVHWKELTRERSEGARRLHERLEATSSGIRNEMDTKLVQVWTELKELPGRVITVLRDTGAIGGHRQ